MNVVDLNADVGESYGLMHSGMDAEIIPHVTSVNIAAGFHSGDPDTIKKLLNLLFLQENLLEPTLVTQTYKVLEGER